MQRFQRLGGMAAIALTALGLSACYPPPPGTVAVAPPDVSTGLPRSRRPMCRRRPQRPRRTRPLARRSHTGRQPCRASRRAAPVRLLSVSLRSRRRRHASRSHQRRLRPSQFGNRDTGAGAADSMSGSPGNMCSGPRRARTGSPVTGSKGRTAGSGPKAVGH